MRSFLEYKTIILFSALSSISFTTALAQPSFSTHAIAEMKRLKDNYSQQIGSRSSEPREQLSVTDCFTYTRNVLKYAFEMTDEINHLASIQKFYEDGGDVAKYLVEELGWRSFFWNPDVRIPADGNSDHSYNSKIANKDNVHYYRHPKLHPDKFIPINYYVVNFRPTPLSVYKESTVANLEGVEETRSNMEGIEYINDLPFCYGITSGARHTFLFSMGDVYEVHWNGHGPTAAAPNDDTADSEDKLYDVRSFYEKFSNYEHNGWLSGVLLCPPDTQSPPERLSVYDSGN